MSNFNPNMPQLPVGVPQAQGIAAAPQVQPQVGGVGQVQPGDQQQPVNPNLPQVQELPQIDPTRFDPSGLTQVVPQEVVDHLTQWHQTVMQHHVAQLQSVKDREIAQLRQQYKDLQNNYYQYAVQVQPEYADYLEQQRLQAEYQEQMQQVQPDVLEGQKFRALSNIVRESGGAVRMEDLMDARNIHEARSIAAQIAAARQRVPQVPSNQMNTGPSGGYAESHPAPPISGSKVYDNVWAHRSGMDMPHKDPESQAEARRWLQHNGW